MRSPTKYMYFVGVYLILCFWRIAEANAAEETIPAISLRPHSSGFKGPTQIVGYPRIPSRLVVLEQEGRIALVEDGKRRDKPLLDIVSRVRSGGEMGLLGVAFHPQFESNGRIFVNYTREISKLETVISEFSVDRSAVLADSGSEKIQLTIAQPYTNHNGGQIAFGPDGYLYIGMGDGGSRMDPHGHGQNLTSLLGKILRIDIDRPDTKRKLPYSIPSDNPFNRGVGSPEIWAYGLRNPWRFSFDRATGDLWVADVGQDEFEEINIVTRGGNYGWNIYEGNSCLKKELCEPKGMFQMPVIDYGRSEGISVTGGYVYRGTKYPEFAGVYFFGDFGSGTIWGVRRTSTGFVRKEVLKGGKLNISTFGQGEDGELYVANYSDGTISHLIPGDPLVKH